MALFLFSSGLFFSCNMTGYNDLAEPVNRFGQFGHDASTFMRTRLDEDRPVVNLFTIDDLAEPYGSCSMLEVTVDSAVVQAELRTGTYEKTSGRIDIGFEMRYISKYEERSHPARVTGAVQYELSKNEIYSMNWDYQDSEGIVRLDGKAYESVRILYDRILSGTEADWPDKCLKMILLSTMSAHSRIEGFGGVGMLQYVGKMTCFNGLLFGNFELTSDGLSEVTSKFLYKGHCDMAGIILNGEMLNRSDMNGNGRMDGVVGFEIQGMTRTWSGLLDYSQIEISHTLPCAGVYILTIEDTEYTMDYDYGNPGNFDFTDIVNPD